MGAEVTGAQRGLFVTQVPTTLNISGTAYPVAAYGVYGYESVVIAVSNPKAISWADCEVILA